MVLVMFNGFSTHFDPFTSIWRILVKMKIYMKNQDFIRFSYIYLICGFNSEISTWKLYFQKVQMILYILYIYHFFSFYILNELCSFEDTCKIIRFGHKCFKICYFRVSEIYSKHLIKLVFWWWNIFLTCERFSVTFHQQHELTA